MPEIDPLTAFTAAPSVREAPIDKIRRIARSDNLPDDIADDFSKVTGLESGRSHYGRGGRVKVSPVDPKDGQRAIGFSQIKPSTARSVGVDNPYDEESNIKAGLRYYAQGGNDPIRRRIAYFSGQNSGAVKHYDRTGRIPNGGDFTGTSFKQYIAGTGGSQQDPLTTFTQGKQSAPTDPLSAFTQGMQPDSGTSVQKPAFSDVQGGMQGSGPPLTTNDAAWHLGMTPEEAKKLTPKALSVLSEGVAEDQRKKAAGQTIQQPSLKYQNDMRKAAGLKPLKFNVATDENQTAPYYQPSIAPFSVNEKPQIPVKPRPFAFKGQSDEDIKAAIRSEVISATRAENTHLHPEARTELNRADVESIVNDRFNQYKADQARTTEAARLGPSMQARTPGVGERIGESLGNIATSLNIDTPMGLKSDVVRGAARGLLLPVPSRTITPEEKLIDPNAEAWQKSFLGPESIGELSTAFLPYIGASKLVSKLGVVNPMLRDALTFGTIDAVRQVSRTGKIDPQDVAESFLTGGAIGRIAGLDPSLKRRIVAYLTPQVIAGIAKGQSAEQIAQSSITNLGYALAGGREAREEAPTQTVPEAMQGRVRLGDIKSQVEEAGATVLNPEEVVAGGKPKVRLGERINETQTQPNITPQPKSAEPAETRPVGTSSEGLTTPTVETPRHVDLQRRMDDGTFGEETKAETEARQSQVNPAEPRSAAEEIAQALEGRRGLPPEVEAQYRKAAEKEARDRLAAEPQVSPTTQVERRGPDRLTDEEYQANLREAGTGQGTPREELGQIGKPSESGIPDWVREDIQSKVKQADSVGVSDRIEELSAKRQTAKEVVDSLVNERPDLARFKGNLKGLVQAVRSDRGIPSMDDKAEFETWLKSRKVKTEAPKLFFSDGTEVERTGEMRVPDEGEYYLMGKRVMKGSRKADPSDPVREILAPKTTERGEGIAPTETTAVTPEVPTTTPAGAEQSAPSLVEKPETTGIAQRVEESRRTDLGKEPPTSGKGISAADSVVRGRELLAQGRSPEQVVSNFQKNGSISADAMALVRAKHEELARVANQAFDAGGLDSRKFKDAEQARQDFWDKSVKPMQTEWAKTGMAQQGETDIDTGTFYGLYRAFKQHTGKEMSPEQVSRAKEIAINVSATDSKVRQTSISLAEELDKAAGLKDLPPDVQSSIQRLVDAEKPSRTERRQRTKKTVDDEFASLKAQMAAAKAEIKSSPIEYRQGGLGLASFDPSGKLTPIIVRMARNRIKAGIIDSVQLVDSVHTAVKEFASATRREVAEIIAGMRNAPREKKEKSDWQIAQGEVKKELKAEDAKKSFEDLRNRMTNGGKPTPEDARAIWLHMRKYIDGGKDFREARTATASDLGMTNEAVTKALTQQPKAKRLTDQLYKQMNDRRNARTNAEAWVQNADSSAPMKVLKGLRDAMFNIKIGGGLHAGVGGITHAGKNLFMPTHWPIYIRNIGRTWKAAVNSGYYERAMQDLEDNPNYISAKRAGLANDPRVFYDQYQNAQLQKILGAGNRGFGALKLMRQDFFDWQRGKLTDSMKTPEMDKQIADWANHATGAIRSKALSGEAARTILFAGPLEGSRWAWMVRDNAKALQTFGSWSKATPEAQWFAKRQGKDVAQFVGTYFAALALNQAFLVASNSKDRVNITDPSKGDWLRMKIKGRAIEPTGGIISAIDFLGKMGQAAFGKQDPREGRGSRMGHAAYQYARGKLSPVTSTAADVVTQADYSERPMPFSSDKEKKGKPRYTWPEYLLTQQTPIPVAEAVKDINETLREQGVSESFIRALMEGKATKSLLKGVAVGTISGGTGIKIGGEYKISRRPQGRVIQ